MKRSTRLIALALCAALALGLTACKGNPQATPDPVSDKAVYRTLYSSEVTTLNYLVTTQTVTTSLTANVVDCLVEYDSYGNVEPALATSWESNADATVWTFHLRQGVKWVDKDGK